MTIHQTRHQACRNSRGLRVGPWDDLYHARNHTEAGGAGGPGGEVGDGAPPDLASGGELSPEAQKAELKRARDEAARWRVEARDAKARAAEVDSIKTELEKFRSAQMTDIQKAQEAVKKESERAVKLEAQLAEKDRAIANGARMRQLAAAGVKGEAAQEFVAHQLAKAEVEGGEGFKPAEWIKQYLEANPAFAAGAEPPPVPTGGGFPRAHGDPEMRKLKTRVDELTAMVYRNSDDEGELLALKHQLKRLEAKQASASA